MSSSRIPYPPRVTVSPCSSRYCIPKVYCIPELRYLTDLDTVSLLTVFQCSLPDIAITLPIVLMFPHTPEIVCKFHLLYSVIISRHLYTHIYALVQHLAPFLSHDISESCKFQPANICPSHFWSFQSNFHQYAIKSSHFEVSVFTSNMFEHFP